MLVVKRWHNNKRNDLIRWVLWRTLRGKKERSSNRGAIASIVGVGSGNSVLPSSTMHLGNNRRCTVSWEVISIRAPVSNASDLRNGVHV